jgi:hypothetical protein
LIGDLYASRAAAFESATAAPLTEVYTEGSPLLPLDEQHLAVLRSTGERLRGFAPEVVRVVSVRGSGERREVRRVDRWALYDVVGASDPDGPALRQAPARADTDVRMVLVRTDEGWRIDTAERAG